MQQVLVPTAIVPTHPPLNAPLRDFAGYSMGTTWSVHCVDTVGGRRDWQAEIQAQLDRIVAQMSHWEADSDLCRYNRAAPCSWHELPVEFAAVMRCALDVAAASGGAYDPSAGAIVNLWGFGPYGRHADADFAPPEGAAIGAALADCGWQRLRFDEHGRLFQPGGVQLDLSSIAKGYAVDLVLRHLHANGIEHCLVEIGGELRGAGMKPDGQPWWVALEQPPAASDAAPAALPPLIALHGLAVATSGDYRRGFSHAGRRYAHTLDPRSGYPLPAAPAAVSVVHAECMLADAWSTALTVLGVEAGLALAERHGLAARFLVREGAAGALHEHASPAWQEMLS